MHTSHIGYEQQYQVKGPDGTILWQGAAIVGQSFRLINAGAAFLAGHCVAPHANIVVAGNYNPGTSDALVAALYGVIAPATTGIGYLGVALTPAAVSTTVPAPQALVASEGSIVPVQMTSAAGALGDVIGISGTAGVCAVVAAMGASTVRLWGRTIGTCIKAGAALGTAATPTGYSGFVAGVIVRPI